jgi:outer membrane protein
VSDGGHIREEIVTMNIRRMFCGAAMVAAVALAADVGDSVRPTATLEYLFTPAPGIEAIVAWPLEHKVNLNGARAAKQLPPTVTVHDRFNPGGSVSPFIGAGLNYTRVFDVEERGPLADTNLDLGDS